MNCVAVTVENGGEYVDGTFNIGSVGGDQKDLDGVWANLYPMPIGFLVPLDFMMKAETVAEDNSLVFFGFNVTPRHYGSTSKGGDLFNFGITFDHPGIYHLGFLEFQDVKRTYYSDASAEECTWADITNDLDNLPNTITVTE